MDDQGAGKPRCLLTLVCNAPKPHTVAQVFADPSGPVLVVEHMPVGVLPKPGDETRVDRKGVKVPFPLDDDTPSCEGSCDCGIDFMISPATVRAELAAGRRRVVLWPWR